MSDRSNAAPQSAKSNGTPGGFLISMLNYPLVHLNRNTGEKE